MGQRALQEPAPEAIRGLAFHLGLDDVAADVHELPVLDSRGASRLARPAREAAIEVQLRAPRDRGALEHLLHEVDAPARAVELVAQEVVRRARRQAEAAMH